MKTLPNTGTLETRSCHSETSCQAGLRGPGWSSTKPSGKSCVWDGAIPCAISCWRLFGWVQLCKEWHDGPSGSKFIGTGQVYFVKEGEQPHHGMQELSQKVKWFFCPLFNIFGTTLGEQCPFLAVPVRWYTGVKDGQRTGSAVVTGSAWSEDLDQVTPSLHESAVLSCRVEAFHVTCVQTLKLGFLRHIPFL